MSFIIKNNTQRPVTIAKKTVNSNIANPAMGIGVTLLPGINEFDSEKEVQYMLADPTVVRMIDDGELVFRNAKGNEGPSASKELEKEIAAAKKEKAEQEKAAAK